MADKCCSFSFIHVCEDLRKTEDDSQEGIVAEFQASIRTKSAVDTYANLMLDSLDMLIRVKAEGVGRYDSVYLRPDGVVKFPPKHRARRGATRIWGLNFGPSHPE